MSQHCLNCNTPFAPNFEYCPACGQKVHLHRLSLHDVFHDALHYFLHADKSFLLLLKFLASKTGTVAREYVEGKRKKYFQPLNFYLLVAAVYVLLINVFVPHSSNDILKEHPEINSITNPVQKERAIKAYEKQAEALHFINKYSNVISMIAVPLIALIFWLFYVRGKYNYTEHLVACMYMAGFTNLVYAVIFVPLALLLGIRHTDYYFFIIFVVFQVTYDTFFYYRFINRQTKSASVKAAAASLFAILLWTALSGFLVGLYIARAMHGGE